MRWNKKPYCFSGCFSEQPLPSTQYMKERGGDNQHDEASARSAGGATSRSHAQREEHPTKGRVVDEAKPEYHAERGM